MPLYVDHGTNQAIRLLTVCVLALLPRIEGKGMKREVLSDKAGLKPEGNLQNLYY